MRGILIATLLGVASCSAPAPDQNGNTQEASGPDIGLTRAPGVAMSYAYGFRLPAERIAAVQEQHAARCEALTAEKCRITGMTYDVLGNRSVQASLEFRLAPGIARIFAREGIDITVQSGGMLEAARLDSEESGQKAEATDHDVRAADNERAQLTQQLGRPGLSAAERTALRDRIAALSDRKQEAQTAGDEARRKLANTPMHFTYTSGEVFTGLRDGPITAAMKDGWSNVISGLAVIISLIISIAPWAVTAFLLFLAWRWGAAFVRRRFLPPVE